ncbi:hypothetical protein [Streptomyces albus]|uniref:hypothetical protein n=1 Tax=Streptomyces albus TaxID=1888 RepID=UPI0024E0444D|nr:hypothetical protein [Streptomyces albus]GHJ24549.1 hypothetical protein TPA0909_61630 [Streptomyces albus]
MFNSRSARPNSPAQRTLLRAGLLATVVGAALAPVGTAAAAEQGETGPERGGASAKDITAGLPGPVRTGAYGGAVGARKTLEVSKSIPLNPLANTSVDPLDNTLGTQLADFRAVNTGTLTGSLSRGASLDDLPVVGPLTNTVTESLPR